MRFVRDQWASLIADVVSFLRAWWRQDRIRSSPREGKLLRLVPGAVLSIDGRMLEVEQRDLMPTKASQLLRLRCRGVEGHSELWIHFDSDVELVWNCNGKETTISEDEVEVWCEK
jgi:hypothetical protein